MKGFHVPPECQGQTVEVAYACAGPQMIRRTHDRSDGAISYAIANLGDDDWSWYETYEQCNGAPPIADWRAITAADSDDILSDWER